MPESIHKQQHNTWPAPVFKLKLLVQQIYISITEHHNYQISFAFNCCYKSHFASVYCITKSFYEKLCDINQYIFYELYSYEVSICSQTPKMSIFFHVYSSHEVSSLGSFMIVAVFLFSSYCALSTGKSSLANNYLPF